jgi:DNA-binding XRE family transcriptional regulator
MSPPDAAPGPGPASLRAWRQARGLSQADLAAAVGRSQRWIAQVEAGQAFCAPEIWRRICRVLDIAPHAIATPAPPPVVAPAPGYRPYGVRRRCGHTETIWLTAPPGGYLAAVAAQVACAACRPAGRADPGDPDYRPPPRRRGGPKGRPRRTGAAEPGRRG